MRPLKPIASLLLATLACIAAGHSVRAQIAPVGVTIAGLVAHQLTFTPRDLAWLPPTQLAGVCADGTQHVYAGIDLAGVLAAAGLQGADPLQSYITVTGADGHTVLIAWEEIDRLAEQHSLVGPVLALDLDGAPLADGGPIKLAWDGCPTARDVDSVQTITVGTLAPSVATPAPQPSIDSATGLAARGLADADLPGMTPRYVALSEGASSAALPDATYRGYWAADGTTAKAIDSLRTFSSVEAAQDAFASLTPQTLALALGCAPSSLIDAGARGVGEADDGSSWRCVDNLGEAETLFGEVFRQGRVVVSVVAVNPSDDGDTIVTGWAASISARLAALPQ